MATPAKAAMRTRSDRIRVKLKKFMPKATDEEIAGQFVRLKRMAKGIAVLEVCIDRQLDRKNHDLEMLKIWIRATASRLQKPVKPQKEDPGSPYHRLWRVVDGAVRDALMAHPNYLTEHGHQSARNSIVKRVTGSVVSFAKAKSQ